MKIILYIHEDNLNYGFIYGNKARNEKGQFCHK